jgi:hypothetical protein
MDNQETSATLGTRHRTVEKIKQHRKQNRWANKGNNKITELRAILQRKSQNS